MPTEKSPALSAELFQQLRLRIEAAFPAAPIPEDDDIIDHECEECVILRDAHRGLAWNNLPNKTMDTFSNRLSLLTPTAHRYYLPAYLLRSLDPESPNSEFVIYHLCPTNEKCWHDSFDHFSVEQLETTALSFKYILMTNHDPDNEAADPGMEIYWGKYLS